MISVGGFRWREREVPEGGYCDTSSPPKRREGCRATTQRGMPRKSKEVDYQAKEGHFDAGW